MNAILAVVVGLAMAVGCAASDTLIDTPRFVPLADLAADARAYSGAAIKSKGRFFLAFERSEVCDIQQPGECMDFEPTESMLIHREAFNRTEAEFVGSIFLREEEQTTCARNCSRNVVRIVDTEPASQILGRTLPGSDVRRDPEGLAQDHLIEDASGLRRLAGRLSTCAEAIGEGLLGCADMDLFPEPKGLSRSDKQRFNWVAQLIRTGMRDFSRDNDGDQRPQLHIAQFVDDLDRAKTTHRGRLCYCRTETCDFSDAQPLLMNQSVADVMVCLPTSRIDGTWRLERSFFAAGM